MRQRVFDRPTCLDERHRVGVVLFDPRRHGEDIGVEDDVFGGESHVLGQNAIGTRANVDLARFGIRLALFVEGHHDHGAAVAPGQARLLLECLLALFERDGVDDALALDTLEARLNHLPLRRVDHDGDPSDVRLRGDEVQEPHHGRLGVEEALVHVDVDHLRTVRHLLSRHLKCGLVVIFLDELSEARGASDVGSLAHVYEERLRTDVERFQSAQPAAKLDGRYRSRRNVCDRFGDRGDVGRGGAAASADDVHKPALCELADNRRHMVGGLVVLTELVRQPGVGVATDDGVGHPGDFLQMGTELLRAQCAVESHPEEVTVPNRVPKCLGRLSGQGPAAGIGDRAGHDHGCVLSALV